jgi:flagellar basal body-associated protein FliL
MADEPIPETEMQEEAPEPAWARPERPNKLIWIAALGGAAMLGLATGGLVVAPQIAHQSAPTAALPPGASLPGAAQSKPGTPGDAASSKSSPAEEKKGADKKGADKKGADKKDSKKGSGKKGSEKGHESIYIELDNLIVNPAATDGQHFLMVTVSLGVPDRKAVQLLEDNKTAIMDAIATRLSHCTMDWLMRPDARDSLKVILAERIAEVTGVSAPLTVYFPQYVVQ